MSETPEIIPYQVPRVVRLGPLLAASLFFTASSCQGLAASLVSNYLLGQSSRYIGVEGSALIDIFAVTVASAVAAGAIALKAAIASLSSPPAKVLNSIRYWLLAGFIFGLAITIPLILDVALGPGTYNDGGSLRCSGLGYVVEWISFFVIPIAALRFGVKPGEAAVPDQLATGGHHK